MRIAHLAAIGATGLAFMVSASVIAQTSNLLQQKDKAYGYVDLKTGQFHAEADFEASPEATVTTKTYTGTIDTTIVTTIDSTLTKGTTILCDVELTATLDGALFTEVASAPATISGTKATCTVKLPYSWTGPSGGAATAYTYSGTYKVTASYVPSATQPITDFNVIRQTTGLLTGVGVKAIPSTGTVTTYTFDPVI
jgi:hypothetical protein